MSVSQSRAFTFIKKSLWYKNVPSSSVFRCCHLGQMARALSVLEHHLSCAGWLREETAVKAALGQGRAGSLPPPSWWSPSRHTPRKSAPPRTPKLQQRVSPVCEQGTSGWRCHWRYPSTEGEQGGQLPPPLLKSKSSWENTYKAKELLCKLMWGWECCVNCSPLCSVFCR